MTTEQRSIKSQPEKQSRPTRCHSSNTSRQESSRIHAQTSGRKRDSVRASLASPRQLSVGKYFRLGNADRSGAGWQRESTPDSYFPTLDRLLFPATGRRRRREGAMNGNDRAARGIGRCGSAGQHLFLNVLHKILDLVLHFFH